MHKKIFLIISLLFLGVSTIKAQDFSFKYTKAPLDSILYEFYKNYKVKFAFDQELAENIYTSGVYSGGSIHQVIDDILSDNKLNYKIINETYVIFPKPIATREKTVSIDIHGVVRDKHSGETLPFAHIYSVDKSLATVSNQDGYFSLFDIQNDSLLLVVSYMGYRSQVIPVRDFDSKNIQNFYLSENKTELDEVLILGSSDNQIQIGDQVGLSTLSSSHLMRLPSSGESDILRSVQFLPGIKCTYETSSDLVIRGSSMDQNLVLLDDFPVYHVDHFYGMFSAINPKVVKNVQVFKGGFESKFGSRSNSVINITGKTGNSNRYEISGGVDMISANLMFETPLFKNGTFLFAGRRSYTDIYKTGFFNQLIDQVSESNDGIFFYYSPESDTIENLEDPNFSFYDINAKFTYHFPFDADLSISYFSSRDKLRRDGTSPGEIEDLNDKMGNDGISIIYKRRWNNKYYSKFIYTHSNYINNFLKPDHYWYYNELGEVDYGISLSENKNRLKESSFKIRNEFRPNNKSSIDFGFESSFYYDVYEQTWDAEIYTYNYVDYRKSADLLNIYLQGRYKLFNRLRLSAGGRVNYFSETNKFYYEPRLNINYEIVPSLSIKGAFGRYYQFLSLVNVGWLPNSMQNFWILSDVNNIPIGYSDQLIGGLTLKKWGFVLDMELYHKFHHGNVKYVFDFDNYNNYETLLNNGGFFQSGDIEIKGLDVLLSKKIGSLYSWASYTVSSNNNTFDQLNDGTVFPSIHDQRHEFKVASMKKIKRFNISANWIYGTGFGYNYPYQELDAEEGEDSPDLKNYHRLDINLSYNYHIKKVKGNVGISCLNVYNNKNEKNADMAPYISNGETVYDLDRVGLMGFTLTGYINFTF